MRVEEASAELVEERRQWSRRNFFAATTSAVAFAALAESTRSPALAAEPNSVNPFDAVRRELNDPAGGVTYMQKCIDENDFEGLVDFTKQYDQVLRKAGMGNAKKMLPMEPKELRSKATEAMNAVTFDLIGINRASRPGQESAELASKYLQELREDVQTLLDMESRATGTE